MKNNYLSLAGGKRRVSEKTYISSLTGLSKQIVFFFTNIKSLWDLPLCAVGTTYW
ncbi:MAG TPA: hypothetical protein VJY62_07595 [Bacteroidia bacterium]|nr:hypothetical protein [Bacteroidia bacterium]